MRRWVVGCFIATYVSALCLGITCQTIKMGVHMHPAMYFFVWDMYCGWSAYNHKYRLVAEGVSGTYYDLDPAPWGSFRPYDRLDRLQYIISVHTQAKLAKQVADNTRHEPFSRMFIIEESWAKQFDLPEYIWKANNSIPRMPHKYSKVVVEQSGDGEITHIHPQWLETQNNLILVDNPRLQEEMRNSHPFWMVDPSNRYFQSTQQNSIRAISGPSAN